MSISCAVGFHKWDGCKCSVCAKTRDQGHDCSKDCEKCARCGVAWTGRHRSGTTASDIKAFIAQGMDVNARGQDGETALMIGAGKCEADCLDALIAAGADVNAKDRDGGTALMEAANGQASGCADSRLRCIKALIAAGADVNATSRGGMAALNWAMTRYNSESVEEVLKEAGARLNARGVKQRENAEYERTFHDGI